MAVDLGHSLQTTGFLMVSNWALPSLRGRRRLRSHDLVLYHLAVLDGEQRPQHHDSRAPHQWQQQPQQQQHHQRQQQQSRQPSPSLACSLIEAPAKASDRRPHCLVRAQRTDRATASRFLLCASRAPPVSNAAAATAAIPTRVSTSSTRSSEGLGHESTLPRTSPATSPTALPTEKKPQLRQPPEASASATTSASASRSSRPSRTRKSTAETWPAVHNNHMSTCASWLT